MAFEGEYYEINKNWKKYWIFELRTPNDFGHLFFVQFHHHIYSVKHGFLYREIL